MSYQILGQNLHDVADHAKKYFSTQYGAKSFSCEEKLTDNLPLKPTWQASLPSGYWLCIDVRESPFSNSLYEFVSKCAADGLPVKLWVAVPKADARPTFNAELRQAHEFGIGVVEIDDAGNVHEFHRPVPLSLFGLKKTELKKVPVSQRDEIKSAEATFLDGSPGQGCQAICQALEQLTRDFSEKTHALGFWQKKQNSPALSTSFFQTKSWATVLENLESLIDVAKTKTKCALFNKQAIVRARSHTDWRNSVSHKPKTFKQTQQRDARLRTMYESTRDILLDWYGITKPLKLP